MSTFAQWIEAMDRLLTWVVLQSKTIFTGGEDGFVRAWKPNEAETEADMGDDKEKRDQPLDKPGPSSKEEKKKKNKEKRYKPY